MIAVVEIISRGYQARKEGNLRAAREYYAEGAGIYREQRDDLNYARAIRHIADIHRQEGNTDEAKAMYEEALKIYRSSLDTKLLDLANTVRPYALLNEELRDVALARELWKEARHLYRSLRLHGGVAECEAHIARLQQS